MYEKKEDGNSALGVKIAEGFMCLGRRAERFIFGR